MPKQCNKGNGKPPRKPPHVLKATPKAGKKKKESKKQKTPEEIRVQEVTKMAASTNGIQSK